MKNKFQKNMITMMVIALTVVTFVGFGPSGKASAATWRGSTTFVAYSQNTGALYDYAFKVSDTDDASNVYFSIESWIPGSMYNPGGLIYYDAFLLRWNGTSWVKDRWLNGNFLMYEVKSREFSNVPKIGAPTLIWVDFYWAASGDYFGHAVTPSWVR
ncbi:hypothetical protein [Bacillus sp. 1NLA3E]|uniref:hypothetical protein n=1 Tax=Bacillus sp. 1NLA3E TaxID=666686 RepID=UPI000247F424|nr:hypothetical protein [Bacillus sp. 1NLA3E]AGK52049.1 hypothetical protein B1NLA3E_01325 [Bacillus sp. 1NLA3E]